MDRSPTGTTRLQRHWRAVLAVYFPRWKAGRSWRCTSRTRRTAHGHCDCERRLVEIGVTSEDDDALDLFLIHEVAHAVASLGHGVTWRRRIACAAATARKVGRARLAELLDEEIANYRDRGEPVSVAYGEVENALHDNPDLTLAQIRRWLAGLYGLRLDEVGKVFRRLRRVYKEARTEALENRKVRQRFEMGRLSSSETNNPPRTNDESRGRDG